MANYNSAFTGAEIDEGITKAGTAVQPDNLADVATSGAYADLSGLPTLGTAAAASVDDFATAAQGDLAASAVQPGELDDVAFSGAYADLSGLPTLGTAAATDATDYATAAQGALADTAVQPDGLASVAATAIGYAIDGGGEVITTGLLGAGLAIPFSGTIESVTLLADQTGSVVIDIWKDTFANYPPTVADSICASAKPTLSSAAKSEDTTLTGWTTAIAAGDVLRFNVDSASTLQNVTLILKVTKT
jgi:hypothetical protein